jgi:hypothetical protein
MRQWAVRDAIGLYRAALAAHFRARSVRFGVSKCAANKPHRESPKSSISIDPAPAKIVGIDVGIFGFLIDLSSWYLV